MKKKILITGGGGFIGGHLTDRLVTLGFDVIVIDNESADAHKKFHKNKKAEYHKLDINDYSLLALNDMVRMAIIQIVVQILFFLRHDNVELFSAVFLENTLFIVMGVFIYWIIFRFSIWSKTH